MIDIFDALQWLNAFDEISYLNGEAQRLSQDACAASRCNRMAAGILERLQNIAQAAGAPFERGEILLHCAAVEYSRSWFPQAARHAREAVCAYQIDDHRRAVALWMLGMTQWAIGRNHDAYTSWAAARKIFQSRELLFQHLLAERQWYADALRRMEIDLVAQPEEIETWLNRFEGSSLSLRGKQAVRCLQDKVRQQTRPNPSLLIQELHQIDQASIAMYEGGEIYLEFGLGFYQIGCAHAAVEMLQKAVRYLISGPQIYHKQVVARWMLGAVEWTDQPRQKQAIADWRRSFDEFGKLKRYADEDNDGIKMQWYDEHCAVFEDALSERSSSIGA